MIFSPARNSTSCSKNKTSSSSPGGNWPKQLTRDSRPLASGFPPDTLPRYFLIETSFEWSSRMLAEPEPQKKSAFKNPFLYSWTVLGIVALVVCLILVSRWKENRDIERRAREAQTQQQREQDRAADRKSVV